MAFLISPGVQINEIDLTNVIPALATSTGAFAGHFSWGPVGQLVTVSSEKDLIKNFGPPDASIAKSFLTAASFLKYGNNLKISRAIDTQAKNATGAKENATVSPGDQILIRSLDEYESLAEPLTTAVITARYPGAAGNSLRVLIVRPDDATWEANSIIKQNFSNFPASTIFSENFANNIGADSPILDEIHVLVIDDKGLFSGTPGSVLERYEGLSLASDAKTETGATNYYKEVINRSSNYIYITSLSDIGVTEWEQADKPISEAYASGVRTTKTVEVVDSFGNILFDTESFDYNELSTGVAQVETATIEGTADDEGTLNVTVTSALITTELEGTGLTVQVAVAALDTAEDLAAKVRIALNETEAITDFYIVGGTGADYSLTAIDNAANDPTLNLSHETTFDIGIITSEESIDTTPGEAAELIPRVVSNILNENGNLFSVAVTVEDSTTGSSVTAPVTETTPVTVTVTTVETVNDVIQTPVTEAYNITVGPNVNTDIIIETYDVEIEINGTADISIKYPLFQQLTIGGGYDLPTVDGLQNIICADAAIGSLTAPNSIISALEYLSDSETVDINFIFSETFVQDSPVYSNTIQKAIDDKIATIVNTRKDCVGFISAPLDISTLSSDTVKKSYLIDKASNINSSSYLIMDSTPVYVYNKYSDSYVWISACGHMAGLCANADRVADAWFSPAGLNRGALLGVTKLAYNANQTSRDDIYKLGVNPIVSFPGQGVVLYGDKTLQRKPSAFDRINVRRLFITLEKAIATAAKFQLFEQNDEFTRSSFRNTIEPFLRNVQGRRGITDFRVICDSTNNTGEIINKNNFVADIYIKPTNSINYITLNFIATRTGVEFTEIVG
jgi:hypothetical protein